ncbi:MAG: nucleotidyltransferase family protein [Verrucomicrobiae bacterium]|nr:nucleotidyltransferase family protein [Verrucomicrobiae bacterium]
MSMKAAAVILAAGASSRFGRPKQLLEIDGETLVSRACRIAMEAGCSPVVVVLGAHADEILGRGLPDGVRIVINERYAEGMGLSLARGVGELAGDAVVVLLADQPGVEPGTLRLMADEITKPGVSIVWCRQDGISGPPVMFAKRHFTELSKLESDEGGRSVVKCHPDAVAAIDVTGARWDIDDEAAWKKFTRRRCATGEAR